jgi:hypothetical protein
MRATHFAHYGPNVGFVDATGVRNLTETLDNASALVGGRAPQIGLVSLLRTLNPLNCRRSSFRTSRGCPDCESFLVPAAYPYLDPYISPGVEGLNSCQIPASVLPKTFPKVFGGNVSAACELLDPQVVEVVPGRHLSSSVFKGVQAVAGHLSTFLRLTESPIDVLKWEDWMAGVDNVAGLAKIHLQREGQEDDFRVIFSSR